MSLPKPSRGEIWFLNLDPTQGREQAGSRPALVVISVDVFNHGPADLVVVLPVTSAAKGIPFMWRCVRPMAVFGSRVLLSAKTSVQSRGPVARALGRRRAANHGRSRGPPAY